MTFEDILVSVLVAGFAVWAFIRLRKAIRTDREWSSPVREFVASKALIEKEVEWGPSIAAPDTEINWQWLKRGFSRNPAISGPLPGTLFISEGGDFALDEVRVRKSWTGVSDQFLRLSMKMPGAPSTLSVRPAGMVRRLRNRMWRPSEGACRGNLTCRFSSAPADRAREQGFLTRRRCRILEQAQNDPGGIYIHGGWIYLIRKRNRNESIDLYSLYDELAALASRL